MPFTPPRVGELCYQISSAIREPNGLLTIEGVVWNSFSETLEPEEYIATLRRHGYKLGMRIKKPQRIERLGFRADPSGFVILTQEHQLSDEFQSFFGADTDEQWVVFTQDPDARRRYTFPRPHVISYEDTLTITNVTAMPQLVPVVYTYRDEAFSGGHYVLGVRILSTREEHAQICVSAGRVPISD